MRSSLPSDPLFLFFVPNQKGAMRTKKSKQLYHITLLYPNEMTKTVPIRAVTREVAERRALKHNPKAIGVKLNG